MRAGCFSVVYYRHFFHRQIDYIYSYFFVFVATCLRTKSLRTKPCDWIDAVDWKIENAENLIATELISIKIVHHRNGLLSCTRCSWCSNANHSTSLCDFIQRLHFKMNSLFFSFVPENLRSSHWMLFFSFVVFVAALKCMRPHICGNNFHR